MPDDKPKPDPSPPATPPAPQPDALKKAIEASSQGKAVSIKLSAEKPKKPGASKKR